MRNRKRALVQATTSVLCAAVAWKVALDLDGSEFVGGRITGHLFQMQDIACLLFLIAAFVSSSLDASARVSLFFPARPLA